jgi:tetratricopeptide (TPR) repeat protein
MKRIRTVMALSLLLVLGVAGLCTQARGELPCRLVVALQPWSATAHLKLAETLLDEGTSWNDASFLKDAAHEFLSALQLDPRLRRARLDLAQTYDLLGHHALAVTQLRECLRRSPDDREATAALRDLMKQPANAPFPRLRRP